MVKQVQERAGAWVNRWLTAARAQRWSQIVLVFYLLLLVVSFVTAVRNQGQTALGTVLGADFPAFYVAGKIMNEHGPAHLFDRTLQGRLYHELFPQEEPNALLPYLNAPFFVLPFPLLARLPYAWAYLAWFLFSLSLFMGAFTLLWRRLDGLPAAGYRTGLLAALSFMPFLVECLAGGQTAAVGFAVVALAFVLEQRGQAVLSGMVLALLLYKPTLLVLLGPMVLLTRRWRTLAGMAAGGGLLLGLSVAATSWAVTLGWFNTLIGYSQHSTGAVSGLRVWKYVDVNSFARGLWGGNAAGRWLTVGLVGALVLPRLVKAWWQAPASAESRALCWALAILWTPVLNLYVGIYDVSLIVVGALLLAAQQFRTGGLSVEFKALLLLLYGLPWLAQPLAQATGLHLLTLALGGVGWYALGQLTPQPTAPSAWELQPQPESV